jgi:YidC/Oxa1 family membrane protein insertase
MLSNIYHLFIFNPLYNGLIFLFDIFPWIDAGVAVIVFTILVRLILFPLSKKSIITQLRMREITPDLEKIKRTFKDKQVQATKTMELYKQKGVNPFASIFLILLQLPIIYALYHIFVLSGLPVVNTSILYGFINAPVINMNLLGFFDISTRSIPLSLLAAFAQYLQLHFSLSANYQNDIPGSNPAQDVMKYMKYVFPVMIFFISYRVSAVVAIYWAVTSLFTLGQELFVSRQIKNHKPI